MLKRSLISLPLMGLIVMLLAASPSQAIVSTFTGGDAGEGLDLEGDFLYAVNVRGPGGLTVGDANFTADSAAGVTIAGAAGQILNWAAPEFGASANDNDLEVVMQSIRHQGNPAGGLMTVSLTGLTVGQQYKVQTLYTESCCGNRNFDVSVEGFKFADNFEPATVQGGVDSTPANGAVATHTFTAADTTANLAFDGTGQAAGDRNPILSGFTLEDLGTTNVALGKSVVASSTFNGTFVGDNITDGQTNDAQGFQWLGAQGIQQANLVIDLESEFDITQLRVLNTGNAQFLDRSTGDFSIDVAGKNGLFVTAVGPTTLQAYTEGFQDISVNLLGIQFIRYNMLSIADPPGGISGAAGGGLNELEVIGTATVPEPTTAALALLGIGAMARRRRRMTA